MSPRIPLPQSVKSRLRQALESRRSARMVRRASPLAARPRAQRHALVLPAAGVGSLGDEAMLLASGQLFRDHGIEQLSILSYGAGKPWAPTGPFRRVVSLGERYSKDFWGTCEQVLGELETATHLLIQGADVMDGYYSPNECFRRCVYASMAAAAGVKTTIGGFSFNDHPHPWSVRILDGLTPEVRLVARDPLSLRRLQQAVSRPVHGGADMAFLLQAGTDAASLSAHRAWMAGERADGRRLLGVNANLLVAAGARTEAAGQALADAYIEGLAPLLTRAAPVSLLLIPHDHRAMGGRLSDLDLLRMIAARVPGPQAAHVRLVPERLRADAVKALVGDLDLVVSGRMHLVIAALGQGVPGIGVTYQGKFEGLYEHFGLEGMSLTPEALLSGGLTSCLDEGFQRNQELRRQIQRQLPRIHDLALVSFGNLLDEGEGNP